MGLMQCECQVCKLSSITDASLAFHEAQCVCLPSRFFLPPIHNQVPRGGYSGQRGQPRFLHRAGGRGPRAGDLRRDAQHRDHVLQVRGPGRVGSGRAVPIPVAVQSRGMGMGRTWEWTFGSITIGTTTFESQVPPPLLSRRPFLFSIGIGTSHTSSHTSSHTCFQVPGSDGQVRERLAGGARHPRRLLGPGRICKCGAKVWGRAGGLREGNQSHPPIPLAPLLLNALERPVSIKHPPSSS